MSDREGHGHKAIVYKSHFPPLRHSVVTETPARYLANKPRLTKDQALRSLCPHDSTYFMYMPTRLYLTNNQTVVDTEKILLTLLGSRIK